MKKKRCKVVMLPTDKESCIHANKFKTESGYEYKLTYHDVPSKCKNDGLCSGNHHLYITSDDKIEAGDWCLFFWDGNKEGELGQIGSEPQQYFPENGHTLNKNLRKIIATTDPKLRSDSLIEDPARPEDNLLIRKGIPQIPQSFIEEYCRKGGIDEVDVEYGRTMDGTPTYNRLIVNSDNTINIHPIEEKMYSETELIQFVLDNRFRIDSDTTIQEITNWIKK